jgi:thioredoxin-dependent peroxiredoxin
MTDRAGSRPIPFARAGTVLPMLISVSSSTQGVLIPVSSTSLILESRNDPLMKTCLLVLLSLVAGSASVACAHDGDAQPAATPTTAAAPAPTTVSPPPPPSPAPPPSSSSEGVSVGAPPPDFTATAQDGSTVHLAALKGKPAVVYFYPKDETAGCTKEACSFRDAWDLLSKKGVVLIGISADADDSHKAFTQHYKLPFLLVSDSDGKIAGSFGVPFQSGHAARQSFVIGADGLVKKVYRKVDVTVHAQEILADLNN